jgi:butyryl-CoA dehydrogenase
MQYVKERKQFGRTLSKFQRTQFEIADMATNIHAGRLMVWCGAWKEDATLRGDKSQANYAMDTAMAKLFCGQMANDVARRCCHLYGGYGFIRDYPVERFMRDAKIIEVYEGTNEAQRMVISASLGIK